MEGKKILTSDYCSSLTIKDAFESKHHVDFYKKQNRPLILSYIIYILKEFLVFTPHNLNGEGIIMYSEMIINEYPLWKPEDFVLLFKNVLSGKYGKVYGNFTYANFAEWATQYEQERLDYFEMKANRNKEGWDSDRASEKADEQEREKHSLAAVRYCMETMNRV